MVRWRVRQVLALAAVLAAIPAGVFAGDPGELFPDVPSYDEVNVSPVTHQDRALAKPRILVPPPPRYVPAPLPRVVKPTETQTPETSAKNLDPVVASPVISKLAWTIDRSAVLAAFLTPLEQAEFDKDYAPMVSKGLKATPEERRKASDELTAAADKSGMSLGLRRYLMLHAVGLMVGAQGTYEDRRIKTAAVVPLLEDKTLAIGQARLDCLYNLYNTANDPPVQLLEYMVDSHLALARYEIQAGFSKPAHENLSTARSLVAKLPDRSISRMDMLVETQAFVDRGATALSADQRWKAALKANPDDPGTNTFVALAHLAFYHDVERAAPYAAKSDKKEFQAFAAAVRDAKLAELPAAPERLPDTTIALSSSVLDVANSVVVAYDRFSAATLTVEKLTALSEAYPHLPAAQAEKVKSLIANANLIIEKSGVIPPRKGLIASKSEPTAGGKTVPSYATIAGIFKDAPKSLFPSAGNSWSPEQVREANKWLKENRVGQILGIEATLRRVDATVKKVDGPQYVTAEFNVPRVDIRDNICSVSVDARFSGISAATVRKLPIGQVAGVGGYITVIQFVGSKNPSLRITLSDQAPQE